jgi:hypothetical protein
MTKDMNHALCDAHVVEVTNSLEFSGRDAKRHRIRLFEMIQKT